MVVYGAGRGGRPLAIDVSVVHPKPDDPQLRCVHRAEEEKRQKYNSACNAFGWDFTPFVVSSMGSFGESAVSLLEKWLDQSSSVRELDNFFRRPSMAHRRGCVALSLARGIARQLLLLHSDFDGGCHVAEAAAAAV